MKGLLLAICALAAVFAFLSVGGAKKTEATVTTWEAQLTGAQEVPAVSSTCSAFARFSFDDVARTLRWQVTISGISMNLVTGMHIHRGPAGVNGPIIHDLGPVTIPTPSGTINLSAQDISDLRAGNLYINVHSTAHPGGCARAQLRLPAAAARQDDKHDDKHDDKPQQQARAAATATPARAAATATPARAAATATPAARAAATATPARAAALPRTGDGGFLGGGPSGQMQAGFGLIALVMGGTLFFVLRKSEN
jgi:hypothetical protein